jgi:hypothetical protein
MPLLDDNLIDKRKCPAPFFLCIMNQLKKKFQGDWMDRSEKAGVFAHLSLFY